MNWGISGIFVWGSLGCLADFSHLSRCLSSNQGCQLECITLCRYVVVVRTNSQKVIFNFFLFIDCFVTHC